MPAFCSDKRKIKMSIHALSQHAIQDGIDHHQAAQMNQYTIWQILGIWALAAIPMGILSWVVYPAVSPDFKSDPLGAGITRFVLLNIGLVWLFVLSMIIVRKEEGDLRWATIKRRLRLNAPQDPRTGKTHHKLWLWVIPVILVSAAWDIAMVPIVQKLWVSVFPFFAEPPGYNFNVIFESKEIVQQLVGAWWFLGLYVVLSIFNVFLGEELLFRGVLLPKMEGVFGRWSWAANGALFAFYHVHQPWGIAENLVSGAILAYPSWRFRSTWMAVIVHSVQNVFFLILILGLILGFA
jgi:membrane protease YdiL (CAAX protease family)